MYDSDGMLCLTSMELRKQLQAKNIKSGIKIDENNFIQSNVYFAKNPYNKVTGCLFVISLTAKPIGFSFTG